MNLEHIKNQNTNPAMLDDIELDFKPITSGLGFHQQKIPEVKSVAIDRTVTISPTLQSLPPAKKENTVYQSDLSLFYGQAPLDVIPSTEIKNEKEKYYRLASRPARFFAYLTDLLLISSVLGIVLTIMARTISMNLMDVWIQHPNEITPLVITLFCGFYIMYFSIFEKANQSTLGKNLFGIRVIGLNDKPLSLLVLILRSSVGLLNFLSLGLFSYFDLQNKVTSSKVIRLD
jgi:uncharacterized RDD family membrane protein YckC